MSAFTYGTIYTGRVDASMTAATEQVKQQLESIYQHTISYGEATEEAARMSTRAFRGYVFGLQMGVFYLSMFTSAIYMQESAQLSLQDAQENYQKTLAEFGPASEQAQAALRRLERAQIRVDRMGLRATLTMAGLGLQVVSYGYQLATAAGLLNTYTLATIAATVADWGHAAAIHAKNAAMAIWNALIGPAGWAKLAIAGGLILGGTLLGYGLGGGFGGGGTQVNIETNVNAQGTSRRELEQAIDEASRKAKYELRRAAK